MEAVSRIPQKLFFRIGEVCELIKVQPHVLRYWETEFPMLAPQKNRAGQRVYRRKDVEMVLRIRDLLYEEKFTIAGAKKKLLEETRGGSSRLKVTTREAPEPDESIEAPDEVTDHSDSPQVLSTVAPQAMTTEAPSSPEARLAINVLKRNLEDLLTMLNADASITR
jgi:DNA-binding transcriptional MerR regulator